MGKISDALEKNIKEKTIKAEPLPVAEDEQSGGKVKTFTTLKDPITSHNINKKLITLAAPDSFEAESFKLLRAQILFSKDRERPRTIMVTSSMPGEGKTFVAANLAVSIAMGIDEHVLLVDCDLRRSSLHSMFGISNRTGLHEYLTKKATLPDLFIKTSIDKLTLLPAGGLPRNPSELLGSKDMKAFLEEVRDRYNDRFIILDTPPSQVLAETGVMANFVDAIIFVVKQNKTPRHMVKKAIEMLGKEKILGTVVNWDERVHKTYEKYYDYYHK